MINKRPPSFMQGTPFGSLLGRKALLAWIREFLDKSHLEGSFWEFGVFQGESIKEAYYLLRDQVYCYVGFDSFKGLPALSAVDQEAQKYMPGFTPGNFHSAGINFVKANILSAGLPKDRLHLFPGLFNRSFKRPDVKKFRDDPKNSPVIIHLDADLYESTKQALEFVYPVLKTGCWVLCDDFWCFSGALSYGAQRAIKEFLNEHRDIRFQEYGNYNGWSKAFVVEKLTDES